jgi:hypothetical protein
MEAASAATEFQQTLAPTTHVRASECSGGQAGAGGAIEQHGCIGCGNGEHGGDDQGEQPAAGANKTIGVHLLCLLWAEQWSRASGCLPGEPVELCCVLTCE